MDIVSLSTIQQIAQSVGFDACGVSQAEKLTEEEGHIKNWLSLGMHGEMGYMERNLNKRIDPTLLVPGAKSVISVLLNYYPGNPIISTTPPKISRYAHSIDYHTVIKRMLFEMLEQIRGIYGEVNGRAFVDSAPVLERAWAAKSGLGWIGKNGLLINPKLGSYVFIGELVVDIDIEPSKKIIPNRCGTCTRCIDSCPTGAIVNDGVIDSRKCISYLTIEKKSSLSDTESKQLNGWCFGCDICQEVCPWNSKIGIAENTEILPKSDVMEFDINSTEPFTEERYRNVFGGTPVLRSGFEKFFRNVMFAREE